jgi:4-amino-4-deoxy-L-arabinose transferase-like glycosyltransferase
MAAMVPPEAFGIEDGAHEAVSGQDAPSMAGLIFTEQVTDQAVEPPPTPQPPLPQPTDPRWPRLALLAITLAAAAAYSWGLDHDAVHMYYAGAVRSMAGSWHDFFYGAFDRQGSISVDKLPGAFWVQALSVKVFGFSEWALVLPQVIAGTLTIPVLYRAVRRVAGPRTALTAAVIFAVTPAALGAPRGNESDPWALLLILLAADAVLRAVLGVRERKRRFLGMRSTGGTRSLLLAGVWLGLAFQAKMGEAWLPVPAFATAYAIAGPDKVKARAVRLLAAGAVLVAVSLSWITFVALTPASQRPYVDGTTDNSPFSQVFGYNGFGRLGGGQDIYGLPRIVPPSPESLAHLQVLRQFAADTVAGSSPSWHRLLTGSIGYGIGWLLPAAFAGGIAVLLLRRGRARVDPPRAAVIAFGLWLATDTVLFSTARTLIPYYTAMLAPGIAVLCAIGLRSAFAAALGARARAAIATALAGAIGWSAWLQSHGGTLWSWAAAAIGIAAVALLFTRGLQGLARVLVPALALTAALAGPLSASVWLLRNGGGAWDAPYAPQGTATHLNPAFHTTQRGLSSYGAYFHNGNGVAWRRTMANGAATNEMSAADQTYVAVFTSAQASFYVANGTQRILVIGGYTGLMTTPTVDEITAMLDQNRIRYAVVPGPLDTRAADPRIQLIIDRCRPRGTPGMDDEAYLYLCS